RMYRKYEADRPRVPAENLCEVRYEDLVQDPIGQMDRIYSELKLGDFERARPALEAYVGATGDYQTNRYKISDRDRELVSTRWGHLMRRHGYDV
ncbi:MAG TPA: sulfotransferase, partial [Pirellulales bacterium]|nr:sulfotransferase [Pirellulales bacterium]